MLNGVARREFVSYCLPLNHGLLYHLPATAKRWEPRSSALRHRDSRWILLISIAIYLFSSYCMTVTSNVASAMSPPNTIYPVLPDLGFRVVPRLELLWLTDLFVNLPVLCTFVHIILLDPQPVLSTCRIGHVLSTTYLIRSITVMSTSLPDPRLSCQQVTSHFFTTFAFHRCGDCIFSGHVANLMVMLLHWIRYEERSTMAIVAVQLRRLTFFCLLGGCWAILANRSHYTVDVILAIFIVMGVWWSHAHFWHRLVLIPGRCPSLTLLYRPLYPPSEYAKL